MEKYLVMINASNNNNKFYRMKKISEQEFEATWGRIGTAGQNKTYPMTSWGEKYEQKIRKGYKDVTDLHKDVQVEFDFGGTENQAVNDLMKKLMGFSRKFISRHYSVSDSEVTESMVKEAQNIIGDLKFNVLNNCINVGNFNRQLEQLFASIPRKMARVEDYMARTEKDFMEILEREQETLNVMMSRVYQNVKISESEGKNLLEALDLDIRECTAEETKQIVSHIEPHNRIRINRVFRVENRKTEKEFNDFCEKKGYTKDDIHFYYHGSKNQNWYGILSEGLKLNPDAPITGKAFGLGIYFAPAFDKSRNYASLSDCYWTHEHADVGYVAVYKVAMKNPKHVSNYSDVSYDATQKTMDEWGVDGVFAHKGKSLRRDEVIAYREEQSTIRYLIETA